MSQYRQHRPGAKADRALVGLPIFTSDGKKIGKVLATGIDEDDQAVLVAEIERPLGIGADAVAIPTELFVRKSHRIELVRGKRLDRFKQLALRVGLQEEAVGPRAQNLTDQRLVVVHREDENFRRWKPPANLARITSMPLISGRE
jgi:sporulation protein YlmC with PRC-barrel domain